MDPFSKLLLALESSDQFFNMCLICLKQKFSDLKAELSRTERHILKEMGFVCHVEHPHKFISNYLATLETPLELRQEAWNLANDRYFVTKIMFCLFFIILPILFLSIWLQI